MALPNCSFYMYKQLERVWLKYLWPSNRRSQEIIDNDASSWLFWFLKSRWQWKQSRKWMQIFAIFHENIVDQTFLRPHAFASSILICILQNCKIYAWQKCCFQEYIDAHLISFFLNQHVLMCFFFVIHYSINPQNYYFF